MDSSKVHKVKTHAEIFKDVWMGRKLSELRFDDRDYKVGDTLVQREWKPGLMKFTGREFSARISALTWVANWVPTEEPWVILHLDYRTIERKRL